ncbi:RNA-binding S4 domain-containing protein [Lachnospiraceae bacterium NSJ-143]|nr:RNA-binding S4 domain-containing protein [Lachnospiraceae bacterium NSJ-143]
MKVVSIKDEYIKMNQLMKLCGFVGQGSDVKSLIEQNKIRINGNSVTELRKKVYPGDIVAVEGFEEVSVEVKD